MDDNARGMASKILCDLLNIGNTGTSDGSSLETQRNGERDLDDTLSESASTASSLSPQRKRNSKEQMSDVSVSDSEGVASRMSLEPVKQVIEMKGSDDGGSKSVYGNEVEIVSDEAVSTSYTASNKIKFNSMVNYDWELKYYRGCLLAVSSKCIAYALRGRHQGHVVRLLNPETATRTLIKGFVGTISDLAFSHKDSNMLACVDEGGNVYIWVIHEKNGKLEYSVKLHIKRPTNTLSEHHRLIWTPYMPDGEELERTEESAAEEGRPLAITHGNQLEVIDVDSLTEWCGRSEVTIDDIKQGVGYLEITDGHTKPITEGALSPDGAVLATASEDGHIKFWQLTDKVECMHEFQPHDGRPLSCMIFTDNQTSQDKELPMWRFLITGADYNREIKVWCTVTWTCLQTIRFSSPDIPGSSSIRSYLKVGMDLSASYLVISDVLKKVIYVLMFHQNFDEGQAHVTSVAKFHLTHPLLSFIVGQVKLFKLKSQGDQNGQENAESHDHGDDDIHSSHVGLDEIAAGEEKGKKYGVQLQLFCIQTRSMQELLVHFQPEPSIPPPTPSTLSSLTTVAGQSVIHDGLSDLSGMETGTEASTDVEEPEESTDGPVPVRTKLLTPQAFASTALQGSTHPEAVNSSNGSSITMISGLNNSQASVDELLGSSVSSRLSDTTVRSSNSATPQGSLAHESGILTPTTLPLPQSPVTPTSNPSAIPILNFQSSPQMASVQNTQSPASSFEPLVAISNTETQASPFALRDKAENVLSDSKSPSANEQNRSHSPGSMERNIEVSVDDDTRDGGDEELPESQKPEAETLEEENERERKSSSGSSTSESLRPLSARAEGNLICLEDDKRGEEDDVQVDGEDAFTEEGLMEQWDMNGDDGVVPTGRESPESAHALPVGTPTGYSEIGKRPSALSSFVSTPVSTTDLPPQQVQVTMDGGLSSSLEELLSLLKAQQQDIYDLRKQLKTYQSDQQQKMITVVNEVHQVEERVSSKLQNALAEFSREESQRLDKALRDKHSGDKKRHEQLQSTLSQTITTTLSGKLDKSVKAEIKSAVVPSVQKVLSAVQEQLNTTLGQKLTAADTVLKDSVAKIVKSKGVVDAIGTAAASALQGPIQVTYREAFQSTILPSFERACQNMFQQINESFHKGTQQYLQQVTTALDNRKREEKDFFQPVMRQLESQKQSFQATTERLSSNLMADFEVMIQKQLSSSIEGLREEIFSRLLSEVLASVQDSVQKEMGLGLEGLRQQLSEMITSSAQNTSQQSPSTAQTQAAVSRLLESGKVGEAFQEALTAGDLNIVMYVCENVDPEKVFSQSPCPLSQPVLLSLIQQLSVDLAMYTDLKHKYIEEALMALDARDAITREHMPGVLEGLCQQLQTTINEASGPMQRSLKMLLMAARSLIR